jgi:hypothetical protein
MKELENVKVLNEVEEEKIAGGRGDGLPTIFNPGTPIELGQKKDIVTDPANNLYPPLGRPLPFPQDRRGNKATVEAPSKRPGKC